MNIRSRTGIASARSRIVVSALSDVARQLRTTRSRRREMFESAGLRPRLAHRLFRALFVALVVAVLIIPNAAAMLYFGVIASDQFESETRFTVRSSEPVRGDALADLSGIPSAMVVQDTQIIANYIVSRAMLHRLADEFDLRDVFGRTSIDWYARLPADSAAENLLRYWEDMTTVRMAASSGIITVRVRAFSAEEAHAMTSAIVAASETLVNDMNERIWTDATGVARDEVERATRQLSDARLRLQETRNDAGILSVDGASTSLSALLLQLQRERITLENDYQSQRQMVSVDAPHMRVLFNRIETNRQQIAALQEQIASNDSPSENLAHRSALFEQSELEQTLAENRLAGAITALEQLQYMSQQKLLYLNPFLRPTMPEDARHPRRLISIGAVLAASLASFAILAGFLSLVRTRFE